MVCFPSIFYSALSVSLSIPGITSHIISVLTILQFSTYCYYSWRSMFVLYFISSSGNIPQSLRIHLSISAACQVYLSTLFVKSLYQMYLGSTCQPMCQVS